MLLISNDFSVSGNGSGEASDTFVVVDVPSRIGICSRLGSFCTINWQQIDEWHEKLGGLKSLEFFLS